MSWAPPLIASSAAALAPSGVPLSSLMTSCRLGLSRSNSASSAACLRLLAISPGWPCADSGTSSATLTCCPLVAGVVSDWVGRADVTGSIAGPLVEHAALSRPQTTTPARTARGRSQRVPDPVPAIDPRRVAPTRNVGSLPAARAPEQMHPRQTLFRLAPRPVRTAYMPRDEGQGREKQLQGGGRVGKIASRNRALRRRRPGRRGRARTVGEAAGGGPLRGGHADRQPRRCHLARARRPGTGRRPLLRGHAPQPRA